MGVAERVARMGETFILYDGGLADHPQPDWFDPAHWPDAVAVPGHAGGRGRTLFVEHRGQQWVLRHYYRGGLVGRIATDAYWWSGPDRTRAFREWRMLAHLHALRLPAPRPVAARVVRGGFHYTADLLTVRIAGAVSLSQRLAAGTVPARLWRDIGACLAWFHAAGVDHADLNAHNIQVDSADRVHLLDFDRGRLRSSPGAWQRRNLDRLYRSLLKISAQHGVPFRSGDWQSLLDGYRDRRPAAMNASQD
jgi:3-deoxy-D-manno-octulosonic acid kinase